MDKLIEPTYLPFREDQLEECLAKSSSARPNGANRSEDTEPGRIGVGYYKKSARSFREYIASPDSYRSIGKSKAPRQIEKDERLWTAATLMAFRYSSSPGEVWSELLGRCFGAVPPVGGFATWSDAIGENPALLLEAPLPSPHSYSYWLRDHLRERQLIPYVIDAVPENREAKLEGFTHADAIVVNQSNGFAVVFESKVLSDISTEITFDCMRNQIARIIDVMLEPPEAQEHPSDALSRRKPELTCFTLLTPRMFQTHPWSRLYGHVIREYQQQPEALARDLPHRQRTEWKSVCERLGWITWEDCNEVLPGSCGWLKA